MSDANAKRTFASVRGYLPRSMRNDPTATDARFFRRAGQTAYGFRSFSRRLTLEDYGTMFHGDDERVDVESLRLSTDLWSAVARDLLA